MRVVFLALGTTRREHACAESAEVVLDGGTASVVVDRRGPWKQFTFAEGVRMIEMAELERRHPIGYLEWLLVTRLPLAVLRRAARGPIRGFVTRIRKFYERRVLPKVGRRLFKLYSSVRGDLRLRLLARSLHDHGGYDMIVAADPISMPVAVALRALLSTSSGKGPVVTFTYHRSMNGARETASIR